MPDRRLFADRDEQEVADLLMQRALQTRGQFPQQGRITPAMHWGEGAAQLAEAWLARKAGRTAKEHAQQKQAEIVRQLTGAQKQPTNITLENPSGGAPYVHQTNRLSMPDQQTRELIKNLPPEELRQLLSATVAQRLAAQQPKPTNYGFVQSGDQVLRTDPRAGTVEPVYQQPRQPQRPNVGAIDADKYTAESVQRFSQSGDYRHLAPRDEPQGGTLKDRLTTEEGLRKEFTTVSKDFRELNQRFTNIQTAAQSPSAAGDMAIVFSWMKILDPTSAVRETEQADARNASGVPQQVRNIWNRLLTGERLAPEQRDDFVNQAGALYGARVGEQRQLIDQYSNIARDAGVNVDAVILDAFRPQDLAPTQRQPSGVEGLPGFNELKPAEQQELRDLVEAKRRGR